MNGLKMNNDKINLYCYEQITPNPLEYKKTIEELLTHAVDHSDFLKGI